MSLQLGSDTGKSKSQGWLQRMAASLGFANTVSLRETLESAIAGSEGEEDKSLSPQERAMLLNVLGFGETRIGEVMIPRADIVAIEEDQPVAALLSLFAKVGHSRVPVFRSSLDDPVGMVHIKDAMVWATRSGLKEGPHEEGDVEKLAASLDFSRVNLDTTIADAKLVREVLFVPPSMPALTLLAKMRMKQIHLALVVDEFGGTDGLVTFEDLVEEIIGDIADEHDNGKALSIGYEDEAFVASARTPIEDVEQILPRITHVGSLGRIGIGRDPEQPEQTHHMVEPETGPVAHPPPQNLSERFVSSRPQPPRQRRQMKSHASPMLPPCDVSLLID